MSRRGLLIGLALAEIMCAMTAIIVAIANPQIIAIMLVIAGIVLMYTLRYLE